MAVERDPRELELKKHVGSIHCSNTLSLLQRKISNVLLYHAYDELLLKDDHEIAIKKLCSLIGYSSHDYDTIKRALKALISTVLEWNLLGDGKNPLAEDWNASSILSSVGIKGGICTYSYSNRLKKLLYMPEMYGRINIAIQARFKSNYALALYENCIRYQNLPYTRWFALATFRKLMGVPDQKYILFRDFKRRVIDKSVAEINAFSDLRVEPEIEREGHKVNRIRFKLHQVEDYDNTLQNQDCTSHSEVIDELLKFGIDAQQSRRIIEEYGNEFVLAKIQVVKSSHAYIHNKVHNLAAYLKSALKENYLEKKQKIISKPIFKTHDVDKAEELKKAYAEFVNNQIDQSFEMLDEISQSQLKKKFEDYLLANNNKFVLEKYYTKDFSNRIVKSMFRNFLREQFENFIPKVETIEEFNHRVYLKRLDNPQKNFSDQGITINEKPND